MSDQADPSTDKARRGSQSIAAVERALDVLLLLGRGTAPSLGVTEISKAFGLPKGAVHRILTSLRTRDLVEFDPDTRRYLLGPASVALGGAYLSKLNIRTIAASELVRLSKITGETATLSIRNGDQRMYVDQVLPDREVRMEVTIGTSHPLHAGASSKAFLAFMTDEEIRAYIERHDLTSITDATISSVPRLLAEVEEVRRKGYAESMGERQVGAASIAAPVFDVAERVAAVVSVSGPSSRLEHAVNEHAEDLLTSTRRLSAWLGSPAQLPDPQHPAGD